MVQTARLTERLILKELTVSANTYGEVISIYRPVATIYASITSQRGSTSFNAPGTTYSDSISFYMRYLGILEKKKYIVEYGLNDYEIENITHVSRNAATIIECVTAK
jgi:hypothetical protein